MARQTTRELAPGAAIRVKHAASQKHARGTFVRIHTDGRVEYRSGYNGGVYYTALANVKVDRSANRYAKEFVAATGLRKRRAA